MFKNIFFYKTNLKTKIYLLMNTIATMIIQMCFLNFYDIIDLRQLLNHLLNLSTVFCIHIKNICPDFY